MAFHDINLLADTLSPQEFELLLRAYIEKQVVNNSLKVDYICLYYSNRYNSLTCKWSVNKDNTKTEGELLSLCVVEACRREAADKANTLLLLEHNG